MVGFAQRTLVQKSTSRERMDRRTFILNELLLQMEGILFHGKFKLYIYEVFVQTHTLSFFLHFKQIFLQTIKHKMSDPLT